jgi:hypothetical protein
MKKIQIHHFDTAELFLVLSIWKYGENSWYSLHDGRPCQRLTMTNVVEFIAGRMLDKEVRKAVMKSGRTKEDLRREMHNQLYNKR